MVPKGAENEAVAQVDPVDGGGNRLRHEDPRDRICDLAASRPRPANSRCSMIAWSGRIDPDGNSYVFLAHQGAAELQRAVPIRKPTSRWRTRRLVTDPAQRKAIYEKLARIVLDDEPAALHLSPQDSDRAYHEARRLQADAGRAGARGRAEAEVSDRPSPCRGRGAALTLLRRAGTWRMDTAQRC